MSRKNLKFLRDTVLLSFLFLGLAHNAAAQCVAPNDSTLQTKINNAASGATITLCSGSASWSALSISGKTLTLQGQTTCSGDPVTCVDNTIITGTSGGNALSINSDGTHIVTIKGISFLMGGADINHGAVLVSGDRAKPSFRLTQIHVTTVPGSNGLVFSGAYGLMDHSVITYGGSAHGLAVHGDWSTAGFQSWATPLTWGDDKSLFIEDSAFYGTSTVDGAVDGYTGGRVVIRYNYLSFSSGSNGDTIGFHGTDSGTYRSFLSHEVYNNRIVNNGTNNMRGGTVRGGSALYHDNTYSGNGGWYGVNLQYFRIDGGISSSWQVCNGTNWLLNSNDSTTDAGRTCSTTGTWRFCSLAPDMICNSNTTCSNAGKGTCTQYFDGTGISGHPGYPCRDQPGRGPHQTAMPVYVWNNGVNNAGSSSVTVLNTTDNKDYINGSGPPGYVPYTHPHPLQGVAQSRPNAPSGFHVLS